MSQYFVKGRWNIAMDQNNGYRGLQHKTKYNEKLQSIPRVYFCCHREDFSLFFNCISDEILTIQNNISIYYLEPNEEIVECEEYFFDLRQMQLFVVPITKRFLIEKCHARVVELKYAIEQHIPILPIIQEKGLDDLFDAVCGNMQFLNRYSNHIATISYMDRLHNFLDEVLLNEELIQRIRNTFDAYVFFSYRQKDRVYAREIMNLIHNNELYRDIAIWYDEFLTPGEDFNEEIKSSIIKSDIFAMVVTPNLINESNYIMNIEYPLAKNLKKPLLAIEVVETNLELLKIYYPGLDRTILFENKEEIFESLEEKFKRRILRKNKNGLQHNFLMGLAYLNGIDVEINRPRGIKLITFAAEHGLPEACLKLVKMYRHGEYVSEDKKEAAKSKEKYIDYLKSLDGCDEGIIAQEYIDLGYLKREIHGFAPWKKIQGYQEREYDESINAQIEALKYYEKCYLENETKQAGMELAQRYVALGDTFKVRGKIEEFVKYYEKGLKIRHYILEKSNDPQAKKRLIISISVLASVYCDAKKFVEASECCIEGLKKARKMLEAHFDENLVNEIVYLYEHTLSKCIEVKENKVVENMIEGIRIVGEILFDFMPFDIYLEYRRKYNELTEKNKSEEENKDIYMLLAKTLTQIVFPEYDQNIVSQYIDQ